MPDPLLAMNFAIINGQRVPVDDGEEFDLKEEPDDSQFDLKEEPSDIPTEQPAGVETPTALGFMEKLIKPLVDVSPETRQAMGEFEKVHPYMGAAGRTGLDLILGESSPLSLILGGLGAGESVAAGMGMNRAAKLLKAPSRIAGGGMVWHGLGNMGESDTLGGKIGGGIEAALGGLALRGPKPNRTLSRLDDLVSSDKALPKMSPIVNDALPELPNPKSILNETINPNLNIEQPQLQRPIPIKLEEVQFQNFVKKFLKEESGSVDFSKFDFGNLGKASTKRRPLRALDELHDALVDTAGLREDQQKLYKGERSKRFMDVDAVKTQGKKGMYERLSKLKGEYQKAKFEPIEMNPDSARALYNEIQRSTLSTPEKIRTSVALGKLLGDYQGGSLPQRNEIELLRKVFGDPVADQLTMMHAGVPITKAALNEVANLSKSIMSSYDMSAPFRQGLGLIHTKEFWKNYSKMFSYLGRDAYDVAMRSINEHPMYEALRTAGLQITEIGAELGQREEQFASRLAEKIPGVPASERMYTGFLNKTRFDVANRLIQEAEKAGLRPFIRNSEGAAIPTALGKEIMKFVNTATGRGSLGRFEKNAVELNSLFFSPRLVSSRLTMLNPVYYINASPFVRKEALKSLFAMATAGKIVEELGKAAGGTVDTEDPTSTDYHKVRIGNTRIDPYGGFQQYIVAANRLLAGAYNSALDNKDGMKLKTAFSRTVGVGGRFPSTAENKLSPLVKFADDILSGRPAEDNAKHGNMILNTLGIEHKPATAKIANQFTPMMLQDLQELMLEDPSLIPLSLLGASGMGVQTYQPNENSQNNFRQLSR